MGGHNAMFQKDTSLTHQFSEQSEQENDNVIISKDGSKTSGSPKGSDRTSDSKACSKSSNWEILIGSRAWWKDSQASRETDGWVTGLEQSGSGANKCHVRDGDINTEMDGWEADHDQASAIAWKCHGKNGNVKKENSRQGKALVSCSHDACKIQSGGHSINKVRSGWGSPPEQTSPAAFRCHSRDGINIETDGCDMTTVKAISDSWNCHAKVHNVDLEKNERVTSLEQTRDPRKPECIDDIRGWNKALERKGKDEPRKQHNRDGNVTGETDGWHSTLEQAGNDPRKHYNRNDKSKRETNEWAKAHDNSDPDVWKQHTSEGNVKTGTDGWITSVKLDGPVAWERHTKDANLSRDTNGWGTWDSVHGQSGPDAWNCHSGDGNIKKVTDDCNKALDQTTTNPWKQHSRDDKSKRKTDAWGKAPNKSDPDSCKQLSREGKVKTEVDGWGTAEKQKCECHSRDANVIRERDGWGPFKSHHDAWKQHRECNRGASVKDGHDAWEHHVRDASVSRINDEWGTSMGQTDLDPWNHRRRDGNVKRETGELGRVLDRITPDTWKQRSRDNNVSKGIDGWGKALDKKRGPDPWKQHSGDGNVDREIGRWGLVLEQTGKGSWKHHHREGSSKRVTTGWTKALGQGTPNARDGHSRDVNVNREDRWDTSPNQISPDAWNFCGRDGNANRMTDRCGTVFEQTDPDTSNSHSIYGIRKTDGRVIAPGQSNPDALNCCSRDVNCNKETDGSCRAFDQTHPDASNHHDRDGNVNRGINEWDVTLDQTAPDESNNGSRDGFIKRKTNGWGLPLEQTANDPQKHHNGDGNSRRETNGWGKALDWRAPDALKEDGINDNANGETGGWDAAVKKASLDALERHCGYGITNSKSDGWGTALDQNSSDAWNHDSGDSIIKRERNEWGKDLGQMDPDPWKRQCVNGSAKRETDGWGKALDQTSHDKRNRHSLSISPKRGWKRLCRSRSRSPLSESQNKKGQMGLGRSTKACKHFAAGRCRRGSQCWFLHEYSCPSYFDYTTDINGSRYEVVRYSGRDLIDSCDRKYRHQGPCDSEERHELHRVNRSTAVCFAFLKGRCYRGSECKFVHHSDSSDCGWPIKDDARKMSFNRTWSGPSWDDQTTSVNASNSSQWMSEDAARAAAAAAESKNVAPTPEYQSHQEESCTLNSRQHSQIGGKGLIFNEDSLNTSQIYCVREKEELKQVGLSGDSTKGVHRTGTAQSKKEQDAPSANASMLTDGEIKKFKFALAEFVKDILKPTWKEGHLSKEVHKTIVKKVVDKVISVLPNSNIPRTQEHIDLYLSYCETKLKNLVKAYLERNVRAEPKLGNA